MPGNIERQKIYERELLDEEYRDKIADKSEHKCCHCGKLVYFGYGATVDHFVPLHQGGTNRDNNLIMLCKDCNEAKGEMIVDPEEYCKYLKPEHLEVLQSYFDSYLHSFEYLSRKNLLSKDEYVIKVAPSATLSDRFFDKHREHHSLFITHSLKRAFIDDIDRITDYLRKYARKYNVLESEEELMHNVEFWMKFGCIYYIEKNNDIKLVCIITVTDLTRSGFSDLLENTLSLALFSYYSNDNAVTLAKGAAEKIPRMIINEQGLDQLPVRLSVVQSDKLRGIILGRPGVVESRTSQLFAHSYLISFKGNPDDLSKLEEDEKLKVFFEKFKDCQAEVDEWLEEHADYDLAWMRDEIALCGTEEEQIDAVILHAKEEMREAQQ